MRRDVTGKGPRSALQSRDWLHANSLFRGARGNILMSLHHRAYYRATAMNTISGEQLVESL